jgi:Putative zinc-finger
MSWHADPEVLERYVDGSLDDARAYSVEAHLLVCERCRSVFPSPPWGPSLDDVWGRVDVAISSSRVPRLERAVRRLGVPDHVARLLAATPSLRLSWLGAVAVTLGFAVAAAHGAQQGVLAFLIVAPLVPLFGAAAAYGPGVDPAYEVALAAPMRGAKLLLIRALAVLVASLALVGASALGLPTAWASAAWLLPALGLVAASLALTTVWSPVAAMVTVASAWIAVVLLAETDSAVPLAAFHAAGQWTCAAVAILSLIVLLARRESFERRAS